MSIICSTHDQQMAKQFLQNAKNFTNGPYMTIRMVHLWPYITFCNFQGDTPASPLQRNEAVAKALQFLHGSF